MKRLQKYLSCGKGATAIEYALIAVGVALAISVAVFAFGDQLYDLLYSDLPGALNG